MISISPKALWMAKNSLRGLMHTTKRFSSRTIGDLRTVATSERDFLERIAQFCKDWTLLREAVTGFQLGWQRDDWVRPKLTDDQEKELLDRLPSWIQLEIKESIKEGRKSRVGLWPNYSNMGSKVEREAEQQAEQIWNSRSAEENKAIVEHFRSCVPCLKTFFISYSPVQYCDLCKHMWNEENSCMCMLQNPIEIT